MRTAVMGAGGVGGFLGGKLALAGEDVTFIARGKHLEAVKRHGLHVKSTRYGNFVVTRAQATDDPKGIGPVDLVLFCVKGWDTLAAGRVIKPVLLKHTGVLSLQNGVRNEETLGEILGKEHVLGGAAFIESAIAAPGVIEHRSALARIVFGELNGQRSPRARAFLEAFRRAGIDAELSGQILSVLWTKFMLICAHSGVGGVTRMPLGPILDDPHTRSLFVSCMREVEAVAQAKGVKLPPSVVEDNLKLAEEQASPAMRTSLQKDLERGNRLELDSLNGDVVRMGRELGIETPVNRLIYAALKLHKNGNQSALAFP